jgi:YVTN family beta-propeller protein
MAGAASWKGHQSMRTLVTRALTVVLVVGSSSVLSAAVPTPASAAHPRVDLISNGGFEAPIDCPADPHAPSGNVYSSPSTAIPGWTVGTSVVAGGFPPGVGIACSTTTTPGAGSQSLDLSGDAPGSVSQVVPTTPGTTYTLSWYGTGDPACGQASKAMDVYWNGTLIDSPTFNVLGKTGLSVNWSPEEMNVAATSATSTVEFSDVTPDGSACGALLDDVSLIAGSTKPVVTSVSGSSDSYVPAVGSTGGYSTITITGTGFTGASTVSFGAVPALSDTVVTDTKITAVSPPQAAGAVPVSVTNSAGTSSTGTGGGFSYIPGVIENGGFENPAVCPSQYQRFNSGSTDIPGWTVGGGGAYLACNDYFQTQDGSQAIDLIAGPPSSVSQTIATTVGDTYSISASFAVGGSNCQGSAGTFGVYWNGALIAAPTMNSAGHSFVAMGWMSQQFSVSASGSSSVLEFSDTTQFPFNCEAAIDDVTVSQSPASPSPVLVANNSANTVSVINGAETPSTAVTTTLPVTGPGAVAVTPDGHYAYVASGSGQVDVIDGANTAHPTVSSTTLPVSAAGAMAITPDGQYLYVATANNVTVFGGADTATPTELSTTLPIGPDPSDIVISPNGQYAYVTDIVTDCVTAIQGADTTSPSVLASYLCNPGSAGAELTGAAITPDGQNLFVTARARNNPSAGHVFIYSGADTGALKVFKNLSPGPEEIAVTISPDGQHAYVVSNGIPGSCKTCAYGSVNVIDNAESSNPTISTADFLTHNSPESVAFSPDGRFAYVDGSANTIGSGSPSSLWVISNAEGSTPTLSPTTVPLAGEFQAGIAVPQPAPSVPAVVPSPALVANSGSDSVSDIGPSWNVSLSLSGIPGGVAVTPDGKFGYVATQPDTVSVIAGAGTANPTVAPVTLTVGSSPQAVAVNPDGRYAYVTNTGSTPGTVSVISAADSSSPAVTPSPLVVGNDPTAVAFTPDGRFAYVTNAGSGTVSVIGGANTDAPTVVKTVSVGGSPHGVAITPDSQYAYVTDTLTGNDVTVLAGADSGNPTVSAFVTVGSGSGAVAITPDGQYAYVLNTGAGTVSQIGNVDSLSPGLPITIPVGGAPQDIAISADGRSAYVTDYLAGSVDVIDGAETSTPKVLSSPLAPPTTGSDPTGVAMAAPIVAAVPMTVANSSSNTVSDIGPSWNVTLPVGSSPFGAAVTPDGTYAYVADSGSDTLSQIVGADTADPTVTSLPLPVGSGPVAVAITPDGSYAYVTDAGSGTVSVIDGADTTHPTVSASPPLTVGSGPAAIAITPDGRFAYVTDAGSGTVSVIDGADSTHPTVSASPPLTVGNDPDGVAITPDGQYAYVTNGLSGTVSVIDGADTTTPTVSASPPLTVGNDPTAIAITPDGQYAYVTSTVNGVSGTVNVIAGVDSSAPSVSVPSMLTLPSTPQAVAISPDGQYAYVATTNATNAASTGEVNIIEGADSASPTVSSVPLTVGDSPFGLALTVPAPRVAASPVLVVNAGANTVSDIGPSWDVTLPVGPYPDSVAVTPDGKYAIVSNSGTPNLSNGTITVIAGADSPSARVLQTIGAGSGPQGVAITPNGLYAYVTNYNGLVYVFGGFETGTPTVIKTLVVGSGPESVAITPDGKYAYVTNGISGTVSVIDNAETSPTVSTSPALSVGGGPTAVAITPDGKYAYVSNGLSGTVSVVDGADTPTPTVSATTLAVGSGPQDVAITPDGLYAYVTNYLTGTVSVLAGVDTAVPTVSNAIAVGSDPYGIAITPDGRYAEVTDRASGTVSVIDGASSANPTLSTSSTMLVGTSPTGVAVAGSVPHTLAITPPTLRTAKVGATYSATFAATGGTAPYTWSISSGSPPAGLTLSSAGVLTGKPTTAGTSSFTVKVHDNAVPALSATRKYSLTVSLSITPAKLKAAKVGSHYTATLTVAGGTAPYTWSVSSGSPPAGLTLSGAGVLTGKPTTAGTSKFTVTVHDSAVPALSTTKKYHIIVKP